MKNAVPKVLRKINALNARRESQGREYHACLVCSFVENDKLPSQTLTSVTSISVLVRLLDFLFHFSEFLLERTFSVRHFTHFCLSISTEKKWKRRASNWPVLIRTNTMKWEKVLAGMFIIYTVKPGNPRLCKSKAKMPDGKFGSVRTFTLIYRKRLGCVWPLKWPRIIPNGNNTFHSRIFLLYLDWKLKTTFRFFRKFSSRLSQNYLTIYISTEIPGIPG